MKLYELEPSDKFTTMEEVETPDGPGFIICQDRYLEIYPWTKQLVFLDRWGVHVVGFPGTRYYPTDKIVKQEKGAQ